MKINFYDFDKIDDEKLKFAVIMASVNGKWVFVKHKERNTWEIPGGHREENEAIHKTATRELFEETGAISFDIKPICIYSVKREKDETSKYTDSFGGLYYADIYELGELPESEIREVCLFADLPDDLTYPMIQPYLFEKVKDFMS